MGKGLLFDKAQSTLSCGFKKNSYAAGRAGALLAVFGSPTSGDFVVLLWHYFELSIVHQPGVLNAAESLHADATFTQDYLLRILFNQEGRQPLGLVRTPSTR
jgi:hypothetical protein